MPQDVARTLGFGCAGLYALPTARERRGVLEDAYDLGIRHFDTAPIYGLGRAEMELSEFRARRPDITITTKFGVDLTPLGRLAGVAQSPIRRMLGKVSGAQQRVKSSGGGPSAGVVGRLLYRADAFTVDHARASLARSRQLFGDAKIDYFLLHEPSGRLTGGTQPVVDFLESQRQCGSIGAWGLAGEVPSDSEERDPLVLGAGVIQRPYALDPGRGAGSAGARRIYFGLLSQAFGPIRRRLETDRALFDRCCDLADKRLDVTSDLPGILIRDAVEAAPGSMVLISSTRRDHLRAVIASLAAAVANEIHIVDALTDDSFTPGGTA